MDTDVVIGAINGDNTNESFIEDRYGMVYQWLDLDRSADILPIQSIFHLSIHVGT